MKQTFNIEEENTIKEGTNIKVECVPLQQTTLKTTSLKRRATWKNNNTEENTNLTIDNNNEEENINTKEENTIEEDIIITPSQFNK